MELTIRGLVARYGSGANALTAVDGVDLTVPSGATLGLVGESGCGKSTIARAIVGLVPMAAGTVRLDGEDFTSTRKRDSRTFRRRVQMVFQDPYASLNPRMTVGEAVREVIAVHRRLPRAAVRAEIVRVLELVHLPATAMDRYPHQFSGGQRQRVAIARALAVGPELVISDEVTSSLDASVQASVLDLMRELQRELGLSYLFISHDLSVVRFMSASVAVMYLGRIVERAASNDLFGSPCHPYTDGLIASIPKLGERRAAAPVIGEIPDPRDPPPGCRFHTRCPIGPLIRPERTICVSEDPQPLAASREHEAACHFAISRA